MDILQVVFDRAYGFIPRRCREEAVKPMLVGHRGLYGHPHLKENTLEAFDVAVKCGGALEFDLHLTRDGVPVVLHDPDLKRIHGVDRAVRELTVEELNLLAPAVPTLEQVLKRYGRRCPHYFIEPKLYTREDGLDQLMVLVGEMLEKHQLTDRATILSTRPAPLDYARKLTPAVNKAYVFMVNHRAAVAYARKHGDTGIAGWYFSFPHRQRRFLHERGLHVGVGQIDYKNTLTAYSNRGFPYQFTNRIDRLSQ